MKKKISTLIFLLAAINNFLAADIYVNSSGASGTYNTLSAAHQAANDGDRIIISEPSIIAADVAKSCGTCI